MGVSQTTDDVVIVRKNEDLPRQGPPLGSSWLPGGNGGYGARCESELREDAEREPGSPDCGGSFAEVSVTRQEAIRDEHPEGATCRRKRSPCRRAMATTDASRVSARANSSLV